MLTVERLKEVLHYDPATGVWTRRISVSSRAQAGMRAGSPNKSGHRVICIDNRKYYTHRLAVLYVTGAWPAELVDHANVTPGDDRWENLRQATETQNHANSSLRTDNTSGIKGVVWSKQVGKWVAQIGANGRTFNLGYFSDKEAAAKAYQTAAERRFGEFARMARAP